MNKKYIVYQTTCKVNNKIYIGVHETLTDEFDGYLGCGVDIYLLIKIQKLLFNVQFKNMELNLL